MSLTRQSFPPLPHQILTQSPLFQLRSLENGINTFLPLHLKFHLNQTFIQYSIPLTIINILRPAYKLDKVFKASSTGITRVVIIFLRITVNSLSWVKYRRHVPKNTRERTVFTIILIWYIFIRFCVFFG